MGEGQNTVTVCMYCLISQVCLERISLHLAENSRSAEFFFTNEKRCKVEERVTPTELNTHKQEERSNEIQLKAQGQGQWTDPEHVIDQEERFLMKCL